jgi:hypothetical protein
MSWDWSERNDSLLTPVNLALNRLYDLWVIERITTSVLMANLRLFPEKSRLGRARQGAVLW